MRILYIILIAFRNLRRNKRRTVLTIAAISFSLVCLLVFGSLKEGLHLSMIKTATQFDIGTIQVKGADQASNVMGVQFLQKPERLRVVAHEVGVERIATRLTSHALLLGKTASAAVLLSGVNYTEEQNITTISSCIISGAALDGGRTVLLGLDLAENLGLELKDEVTILAQDSIGDPVSEKFQVVGFYTTGVSALDQGRLYVPLQAAQQFLNAPGRVSEIVMVTPLDKVTELADALRRQLHDVDDRARVFTWQEIVPDVKDLIELNSVTMNILIGIVFVIVAMGIANTMTTITFERFREFGILSAMGTTPLGIVGLVSLESALLGGIAAVIGGAGGFGLCLFLASYGIDLTQFTSSNQYFANNHILKAVLSPQIFIFSLSSTIFVSFLAGLYPAWKASRLESSESMVHL